MAGPTLDADSQPGGKTRAEVHLKRGHVRKLEQFGFASKVPDADDARGPSSADGRRG